MFHFEVEVFSCPLSDMGLTQRRRGLAEGFLVFSCQFSVVSHTRHAGFWLVFTGLGLN